MHTGDSHNFGRRVESAIRSNLPCIFKPRTVFWEEFFFGLNSPFRRLYRQFGELPFPMEIDRLDSSGVHDNWIQLIDKQDRSPTEVEYRQFGSILAYSFLFGIQDLHRDNAFLTDKGFQVVDVEQVFSDLILPNQTLLLPTHATTAISAGLNVLGKSSVRELDARQARRVLDGYIEQCSFIFERRADFFEVIQVHEKLLEVQPIRVFFRRTRDYVDHLSGKVRLNDVFAEEHEQLARGGTYHIFFSYLGSDQIFYYVSADWKNCTVRYPSLFEKFVSYARRGPKILLKEQNLFNKWATGALFLMRHLEQLDRDNLKWKTCHIDEDVEKIRFFGPGFQLQTRRRQPLKANS
ncbi:MAG: DUF4135 domain-containing protein [Bdellovibrionaceae bacterium]|nr:DUF4135 domain-containing protein [Pseudobdellovibrionaceae bacterium]